MEFSQKIVVKSGFSIIYQPLINIRKLVFDMEERFKGEFQSPELIPVPDEAPPEIPRIIFRSTFGHSTLAITPIRTDLNTEYDEAYNLDIYKCFDYIANKSKSIQDFISVSKIEPIGIALSLNVRWPVIQTSHNEFVRELQRKFLPDHLHNDSVEDFKIEQYSRVDDILGVRNTFNTYRVYQSKVPITSPHTPVNQLEMKDLGLELNIEANDRIGFNNGHPSKGMSQLADFISVIRKQIADHENFIIN